ncbi:hypothetical protein [Halovivax sp.]|uniref:hypothetical protein n=1 Tax=Halovivax sp. TaxID=1935978 RepID=UPI0025C3A733|nr:hypothetical protein [Halovivax sp.]
MIASLVIFAVSLLIGALGIYLGAKIIVDVEDYTYAIVTALIGAIIWAVVALFLGWIPGLGPLLALLAYLAVVNWRYPGGWTQAIGITLVAWVSVFIVLSIVALLTPIELGAIGVPGV